jgi:hypothetical protein
MMMMMMSSNNRVSSSECIASWVQRTRLAALSELTVKFGFGFKSQLPTTSVRKIQARWFPGLYYS